MTAPTPSAAWPLPSLITSLKRAGWGPLHGREHQGVRSTLLALEGLLPHKSAEGRCTAWQVAEAAGLSEKWTRRCLTVLEDIGIITWRRGTILRGEPLPSFIRVQKRKLVQLIRIARGEATRRLKEHQRAFIARLSQLRGTTIPRYQAESASARAELGAHPTYLKVEGRTKRGPSPTSSIDILPRRVKEMATVPTPRRSNWPTYCPHEHSHDKRIIYSCVDCRWTALSDEQIAEYDAERLQEEKDRYTPAPSSSDDYDPVFEALRALHPDLSLGQIARLRLEQERTTA